MKIIKNAELTAGASFTQNSENSLINELVPVVKNSINGTETQTVSARNLHHYLSVRRDFTSWIKGRIEEYEFIENEDFIIVETLSSPNLGSAKSRQQIYHDYILSLGMAKELAMVERNEQGRIIRRYFIQCEEQLKKVDPHSHKQLVTHIKARLKVANYFKPMCSALTLSRLEQGKSTGVKDFTNEANMLARLVLGGMTSKQWAQANNIQGDPRDSMSDEQLEHLSYLEQSNITLIELGWSYQQRKEELTRLSQRYLAKRIGIDNDD